MDVAVLYAYIPLGWVLHSSPLRYLSSNTLVLHLVLVIRKASQKTYLTSLGLDGCVTSLGKLADDLLRTCTALFIRDYGYLSLAHTILCD